MRPETNAFCSAIGRCCAVLDRSTPLRTQEYGQTDDDTAEPDRPQRQQHEQPLIGNARSLSETLPPTVPVRRLLGCRDAAAPALHEANDGGIALLDRADGARSISERRLQQLERLPAVSLDGLCLFAVRRIRDWEMQPGRCSQGGIRAVA